MFTVGAMGKFKIWVRQGGTETLLSQFCLFSQIFCLFLQFFTLEYCYIWFTLCLEYPSASVYSFALVKFKILTYLGVCKPCFEPYCLLSEFFSISSIFYMNHVGYVMLSVFELVLAPSDLLACGLLICNLQESKTTCMPLFAVSRIFMCHNKCSVIFTKNGHGPFHWADPVRIFSYGYKPNLVIKTLNAQKMLNFFSYV